MRVGPLGMVLVALVGLGRGVMGQECDVGVSFVDFGSLDFRRGGEVTGRVVVRCERPQSFAIVASQGHGSYGIRRMQGPGGAELRYNLYLDPARRIVWGDGTAGTARLVGESFGKEASFVVYAFVPKGQSVPPGQYSDALAIALER